MEVGNYTVEDALLAAEGKGIKGGRVRISKQEVNIRGHVWEDRISKQHAVCSNANSKSNAGVVISIES